ncbi:MAG: DeoR family transcriptional regulator [Bacteroidetes bacterium]|nr:DeoR family transcriptional regulator [Bacteroidota bacterium]
MLRDVFQRWMNHPGMNQELLKKVSNLSVALPQKQKHFGLEGKHLEDVRSRHQILDCAINTSLEQENFRNMHADELFAYASRLEDKYAGDIGQLKFFLDHISVQDGFYASLERAYFLFRHFDEQEELMRFFETQEFSRNLEAPLRDWMRELSAESHDFTKEEIILASWFIHFAILGSLPSLKRHTVFARLTQLLFLRSHHMDACGLLALNLSILPKQAVYKRACDQFKFKDVNDLLKSDLSNLINFGMDIHWNAITDANLLLREIYQDQIEYEDYTPRQRNMVNFFFDQGLRIQKPDTSHLNERQQKIIDLIFENHFSSTKDLSLIFRCNRKTIQRDFTELLDMGMVRQMGNGAALRYTVTIKDRPYNPLERLQNLRLGEVPVQISLFGDTGVHKKTPTASNRGLF